MRCFEKVSSCDTQQIIVLNLTGHEQIKDGYVFTLGPGKPLPSMFCFKFDTPTFGVESTN